MIGVGARSVARQLGVVLALSAVVAPGAAGCSKPQHGVAPVAPVTAAVTKEARASIDANGFVMFELGREPMSFHLGYSMLFRAHHPVYITADAVLHAWHSSYDVILANIEEEALAASLGQMLGAMRARTSDTEVARYLGVAEALLNATDSNDEAVKLATEAAGTKEIEIFGASQSVDFSMFKPRGHYTRSKKLSQYFRAMSWLGRVELRFAEPGPDGVQHLEPRAYAAVRALRASMTPKEDAAWRSFDAVLGALVGPPDSLSVPGWDAGALGEAPTDADLRRAFSTSAAQRIRNQLRGPVGAPLAFVFMGPRYVFDSHVFTSVTYGDLETHRMMPSPLDIGAAVFDSSIAKKELAPERKRYGAEYERALDAIGQERTRAGDALWKGSVYHLWLDALRELSPDAERDQGLPAPLSSEVWGRRMLNTQLGAWAELRHDNILYAKQSYTSMALCEYPDGYVDPYPRFWAALEAMAIKARAALVGAPISVSEPTRRKMDAYLTRFTDVVGRLRRMAERARRNEPLAHDDLDFLNHMVAVHSRSGGCTTIIEPEGWFADLYYAREDVLTLKPIIADVHTQPTDENGLPVGRVLHVGTANPRAFVVKIAHDGGKNAQTYRGLTTSYAELITKDFERLTDESWRARLSKGGPPAPPPWLADMVAEKP